MVIKCFTWLMSVRARNIACPGLLCFIYDRTIRRFLYCVTSRCGRAQHANQFNHINHEAFDIYLYMDDPCHHHKCARVSTQHSIFWWAVMCIRWCDKKASVIMIAIANEHQLPVSSVQNTENYTIIVRDVSFFVNLFILDTI